MYRFEDLFFLKIPQYELPSNHHRIGYPLLRAAKLLIIAITICFLGTLPILALILLSLLHILELIYIKLQEIVSDDRYLMHKTVENVSLVVMDLMLLGLLAFSSLASS